jgi:hypothetical protein
LDGADGDEASVTIMNNQDVSTDRPYYLSLLPPASLRKPGHPSAEIDSSDLNCSSRWTPITARPTLTDTTCNAMFTIAFNAPPSQSCDKTQVEFNIYSNGTDTYDISLVNGL